MNVIYVYFLQRTSLLKTGGWVALRSCMASLGSAQVAGRQLAQSYWQSARGEKLFAESGNVEDWLGIT